jgi:TRAP-type uncharacterized transport system fused permease subunit
MRLRGRRYCRLGSDQDRLTNWQELIYIIPVSILGMFCWSVFIQGHWIVRTYLWERIAFLGLAFLLVNPSGMIIAGVHISPHIAKGVAIAAMALFYFRHRSRKKGAAAAATPTISV